MIKSSFTKYLVNITLVLLIIFLFSITSDFLKPIYNVLMFLLTCLILSVYIFYAFRPIRDRLTQWTKKPTLSAALTFILFLIILAALLSATVNIIYTQSMVFLQGLNFEKILSLNRSELIDRLEDFVPLQDLVQRLQSWLQGSAGKIPSKIGGILGNIGSITSNSLIIILGFFYILKDEDLIVEKIQGFGFGTYHNDILEILSRIHKTLKTYIAGQILVAFVLGILMLIGYLIIGLDYAISLALIAMMMNFIPFIGPFLGAAPAVLVALTISPTMILKVIIVSIIVQQAEGNLITPNIMGKKLDIHPFIVILAVLVCINLFGILGALIASPLYMVIKIIIEGIRKVRMKKKNMCSIKGLEMDTE